MTHLRRLIFLIAALAVASAASAGLAAASPATWSQATDVQAGTDPILAFSPTGAAVLGSEVLRHGHPSSSLINLAPANGAFSTHPWNLHAPSAGHGAEPLAALALSSGGEVAALFHDASQPAAVLARVSPGAPAAFGSTRTLINAGGADSSQAVPDSAAIVATARGEIVGAAADDAGALSTLTLGPHSTRFSVARGPSGLSATDAYALATDPGGDTFLAGDGADGCTTVAVRAPHGHFHRTYAAAGCQSATPNLFDAISATSGGRAAMLTEDASVAGTAPIHLRVQVGAHGRFRAGVQLGDALGGPVGLATDADGAVTAEWTDCVPAAIHNARVTLTGCAIRAATGSIGSGFSASRARGTTLLSARPHTTLSALTADRAVVAARCGNSGAKLCSLSAFTARPGGFRRPHPLGRASALIALAGDQHGNVLAIWRAPHGHLMAATASARTGTWRTHTLSRRPVSADQVSAAYGSRGRAVVAWSAKGRIFTATLTR